MAELGPTQLHNKSGV